MTLNLVDTAIDLLAYDNGLGIGPLGEVVSALSPRGVSLSSLLQFIYIVLWGWCTYLYVQSSKFQPILLCVLLAIVISAIHFAPILLSLPVLLLGGMCIDTKPKVSAILISFFSVLLIYPLLGYFYIFYTKQKKAFGRSALISTLCFLVIPLGVMSWEALWQAYLRWIMDFRATSSSFSTFPLSLLSLIRGYDLVSPRILKLVVVNLFHLLLLPCLKARRLSDPTPIRTVFCSAILTFIGIFSEMNTLYTTVISMTGAVLWIMNSRYTRHRKAWEVATLISLQYVGMSLGLFIDTSTSVFPALLVLLPALRIWILSLLEIWQYMRQHKVKSTQHDGDSSRQFTK